MKQEGDPWDKLFLHCLWSSGEMLSTLSGLGESPHWAAERRLDIHMQNLRPDSQVAHQVHQKHIKDVNVRLQTRKLLEDTLGQNPLDISIYTGYSNKKQGMKTKKKMKIHAVNGFGITKGVENQESNL